MRVTTIIQHHYTTWVLLAVPALPFITELWADEGYTPQLLYETGLWSVWLLVAALVISPLMRLAKGWPSTLNFIAIFRKRRRAIGVASFGYALLHVVFYVRYVDDIELILLEALDLPLTLGWLAFLALLIGAAASNKWAQQRLGRYWKLVQRTAYAAAVLTALHWWWIAQFLDELAFWCLVLGALQLLRMAAQAFPTSSALPTGTGANRSDHPAPKTAQDLHPPSHAKPDAKPCLRRLSPMALWSSKSR